MKKRLIIAGSVMFLFIIFVSLTQKVDNSYDSEANKALLNATYKSYTPVAYETTKTYKDRVFYEIFVRAFNDSDGDTIGDLKGVTAKLDYLEELGVSGIWLMPINESPSYHGYDVSNYYKIQEEYGTMDDFYELINEAHKRDIVIVMDLVANHSSRKHPWFLEAMNNKDSKYRSYYTWSDSYTGDRKPSTLGSYPWYNSRGGQYYGIFTNDMPDLNYDNPEVREEMKKIAKYYIDMGVDGFRLDAARHVYDGELDKNLQWWKEFNDYVKSVSANVCLLGEVWDTSKVTADYLTSLDTVFNFDLSSSILDSVRASNFTKLGSSIKEIYINYEAKNKNYLDSTFITNHDMNRVASSLNTPEKLKQAAAILLTLPGTPYIYYGEETGMTGAKPDENIREPFIWDNVDKTKNSAWRHSNNKKDVVAVNVQSEDPASLLNFYKTFINIRNTNKALAHGSFELIDAKDNKVFGFKRVLEKDEIYVFINSDTISKSITISPMEAQVLYSSEETASEITINHSIELKGSQIFVLKKN
jgi:glycosidase